MVEIVRIGGDALQGLRELRLAKCVAGLVEIPIALEDAARIRKLGELGVVQLCGFFRREDETLRGEADGRGHHALQAEFAVFALGIGQACHRTGRGDGAVANDAGIGNHVPLCILVHGFGGGQRRLLAVIDEGAAAVVHAQEQESAAAKIARKRMDDGEGKTCGHGGIHGVAALAKDLEARVGGEVVHAYHHAVAGANGLLPAPGQDVFLRSLGRNGWAGNGCGENGKEKSREFHVLTGYRSAGAQVRAAGALVRWNFRGFQSV